MRSGQHHEPTGCLHRVSKNRGNARTGVLAVPLHPHDTKRISTRSQRSDTEDLRRETRVPELLHVESPNVLTMVPEAPDGTGYDKLGVCGGSGRRFSPGFG